MIRLVAKVGLIVEFNMASEAKEADLVRRFNLQEVSKDSILNLGKHGKIKVDDIWAMSRLAIKPVPPPKDASKNIDINELFGGLGYK